jgi:hypothetical protein
MDQQLMNYIGNTAWIGIIILKRDVWWCPIGHQKPQIKGETTSSPKARMTRQSNGRQQTIEILPVYVFFLYICFNKVYKYKYCLE